MAFAMKTSSLSRSSSTSSNSRIAACGRDPSSLAAPRPCARLLRAASPMRTLLADACVSAAKKNNNSATAAAAVAAGASLLLNAGAAVAATRIQSATGAAVDPEAVAAAVQSVAAGFAWSGLVSSAAFQVTSGGKLPGFEGLLAKGKEAAASAMKKASAGESIRMLCVEERAA